MRRALIISSVMSMALSFAPTLAATTTRSGVEQRFSVSGGVYHPLGFVGVQLALSAEVTLATIGTSVVPKVRFEASGSTQDCDLSWTCNSASFPTQVIDPSAFSMDPAGNSGTFRACLLPTSGPCRVFDVQMVRPTSTYAQCIPACVNPNAWYDPTTNTVGANVWTMNGFYRQGYEVRGVFAGSIPLVMPSNSGFAYYNFAILSDSASN